jgi:hypothetical protein
LTPRNRVRTLGRSRRRMAEEASAVEVLTLPGLLCAARVTTDWLCCVACGPCVGAISPARAACGSTAGLRSRPFGSSASSAGHRWRNTTGHGDHGGSLTPGAPARPVLPRSVATAYPRRLSDGDRRSARLAFVAGTRWSSRAEGSQPPCYRRVTSLLTAYERVVREHHFIAEVLLFRSLRRLRSEGMLQAAAKE